VRIRLYCYLWWVKRKKETDKKGLARMKVKHDGKRARRSGTQDEYYCGEGIKGGSKEKPRGS